MSESPVEHFEHAERAALLGDPFLTQVAVTIAILAVIAATVGSLETLNSVNLGSNPGPPAIHLPDMTVYFQFPRAPE